MSLDNEIVRRGYFNIIRNPRDGMLRSLNNMSSKRQWVVLRKASQGNPTSLELYKNEDQTVAPLRILSLDRRNFKSIHTEERKKAFILSLNEEVCMFQCSSRADMEDWHRDIQSYGEPRSGGGGTQPSVTRTPLRSTHSNSLDSFNGVPDDETFSVKLRKSNTIAFTGECLLEILKDFENNKFHIALFTKEETPRLIVKWQIDHIRQYGSHQSAFKFESGRKSSTGVDWFILDTDLGAAVRIHRSVDYWAKHIVEQVTNRGGEPVRNLRADTLPSSVVNNSNGHASLKSLSSSVPNTKSTPMNTPTSPPRSAAGIYQPLGQLDRPQVYATPEHLEGKNSSSPIPPRRPPKSTTSSNPSSGGSGLYQPLSNIHAGNTGLYQPLDAVTRDGQASLYESLNQETRSNEPPTNNAFPVPRRAPTEGNYMGLLPQRTQGANSLYMDLDRTRS